MPFTLGNIVFIALCLFVLGLVGVFFQRRNIITALMCLEIALLGVNLIFIAASTFQTDMVATQVVAFMVLTVAAAEVAIGLAILTLFVQQKNSALLEDATELRG